MRVNLPEPMYRIGDATKTVYTRVVVVVALVYDVKAKRDVYMRGWSPQERMAKLINLTMIPVRLVDNA